jgi:hypothetical protein
VREKTLNEEWQSSSKTPVVQGLENPKPPGHIEGFLKIKQDGDEVFASQDTVLNVIFQVHEVIYCRMMTPEASLMID